MGSVCSPSNRQVLWSASKAGHRLDRSSLANVTKFVLGGSDGGTVSVTVLPSGTLTASASPPHAGKYTSPSLSVNSYNDGPTSVGGRSGSATSGGGPTS